jgi:peptide/nickel transport system ATP-binding protein
VERRADSIKRKLQMVFQNPDSTLNPSHSVGYIVERSLRRLKHLKRGGAKAAPTVAMNLLREISMPMWRLLAASCNYARISKD